MIPPLPHRIKVPKEIAERLRTWFLSNRRPLPWREEPTSYRVWISEVMLQQTRAEVVIPYFFRWLQLFPDVKALAGAHIDQVIKAWEGLGYYSRARKLHETARYLVQEHKGQLPKKERELLKLGGIGPYTAAAIASFAFGQKAAPIDGNAMRVLTRLNAYDQKITTSKAQKELQQQFLQILPDQKPWEVAEGVIELGALICTNQAPRCSLCPLRPNCTAHRLDQIDRYPVRAERAATRRLARLALIIEETKGATSHFIVRKNLAKGAMRDLWEFPHIELKGEDASRLIDRPSELDGLFFIPPSWQLDEATVRGWTPLVRHTFTRYRVDLRGLHICVNERFALPPPNDRWELKSLQLHQLQQLSFSSGHRRLLNHLVDAQKKVISFDR